MLFDFPFRRKTKFEVDPPPIAWPLWPLQLSLTKWVGFGRAPLFDFAYCLFAVGSRLIFKYKTHCLQKRKSDSL